jgi:hypothetical protein
MSAVVSIEDAARLAKKMAELAVAVSELKARAQLAEAKQLHAEQRYGDAVEARELWRRRAIEAEDRLRMPVDGRSEE